MRFRTILIPTLFTLLAGAAILLTSSATLAHAQGRPVDADTRIDIRTNVDAQVDTNIRGDGQPERPEPRAILEQVRDRAQNTRERVRENREETRDFRADVGSERADIRTDAADMRREAREDLREADTPDERRSILRERLEDRDQLRERRDAVHERISEQAQTRVRAFIARIDGRFNAALERFDNILTRINARITTLTEAGADTTAVQRASVQAEGSLRAAEAGVGDIAALIEAGLTDSTPREFVSALRNSTRDTLESIRAAYRDLRSAIRELKTAARLQGAASAEPERGGDGTDGEDGQDGTDTSEDGADGEDGADETADDGADGTTTQ